MGIHSPSILFVTTHPLNSSTHDNWNLELLDTLKARSINFVCHALLDSDDRLTSKTIAQTFTHVCFLLLGDYPTHHATFSKFLNETLEDALILNPRIRIFNGPRLAAWNSDKQYLDELSKAGFLTPTTIFLNKRQPLEYLKMGLFTQSHGNPVVIKPSISASGARTHLVKNPQQLTDEDEDFLTKIVTVAMNGGVPESVDHDEQASSHLDRGDSRQDDYAFGAFMMQEFIPEISGGELSLIYVGGRYLYTILKRPRPGGWQVGSAFGATFDALSEDGVPKEARKLADDLIQWLNGRFEGEPVDYARVDGIVRKDRSFMLMEVELIEPSLLLGLKDVGRRGCEALCELFTSAQR